jgi:outer membrane protein TolC
MRHRLACILAIATLVAGGCGESEEDKAKTQVCDARADLKEQVDELGNLSLANATVDGVKGNLDAIKNDLRTMTDAQGDLDDTRKEEVEQATQQFTSEVNSIVTSLGSTTSLNSAANQLEAAFQELATSYEKTFGKIDCG